MMGTPDDPGLIPRMNDALFVNMARKLDDMKAADAAADIKAFIAILHMIDECCLLCATLLQMRCICWVFGGISLANVALILPLYRL